MRKLSSVEELRDEYPLLPEGDPVLGMIATAHPHSLETAISGTISSYNILSNEISFRRLHINTLNERSLRTGELIRQVELEKHETLTETGLIFLKSGLEPPADLFEQIMESSNKIDTHPKLLGEDYIRKRVIKDQKELIKDLVLQQNELETGYSEAKVLLNARQQLGRRARQLTLLLGGTLVTSETIALVNTINQNDSGKPEHTLSEIVSGIGSGVTFAAIGFAVVYYASKQAERYSAKRRARKIISNSQVN